MMPNVAGAGLDAPADLRLCAARRGRSACCRGFSAITGDGYGVVAAVLGAGFVWYAWKVLRMADGDRAMRPAKALFAYSLLYLFAIFAAYLADSVVARACWRWREPERDGRRLRHADRQARRRRGAAARSRSALALAALVVIFYVATHRQVRPRHARPGDVRRDDGRRLDHRLRRSSASTASSPASAWPSSAAWSAWPMPPCRSTRMFCQVTGYGGTTQRVEQYSDRVLDRTITVRFDANSPAACPGISSRSQRDVTMKIGETAQVALHARPTCSTRRPPAARPST